MSEFNYHQWVEENWVKKFTPEQLAEFNRAIEEDPEWFGVYAQKIHAYGSLEGARRAYEKEQQRQEKIAASRARNKAAREGREALVLAEPGYVYIYRFRYDGEWLYKFRLLPAKTKRLELFRCVWLDSGAKGFINSALRQSWMVGRSYRLPRKMLDELVDLPTGRAATDTPQVIVEYVYAKPESKANYSTSGYVYVLKGVHGYYKIGRTVNPSNRLATFSVKLPFPVEYYCVIATDDMYALEQNLHYKYANKRVDGEWFFDLTERDLRFLSRLARIAAPRGEE